MLVLYFSSASPFSFSCAVSQFLFHFIQRNRTAAVRILLQVFLSKSVKQAQGCNNYEVILPEVPSYHNDKALIVSSIFTLLLGYILPFLCFWDLKSQDDERASERLLLLINYFCVRFLELFDPLLLISAEFYCAYINGMMKCRIHYWIPKQTRKIPLQIVA